MPSRFQEHLITDKLSEQMTGAVRRVYKYAHQVEGIPLVGESGKYPGGYLLVTPGCGKHTASDQSQNAGRSSGKVAAFLTLTSSSYDCPLDGRFFIGYSSIGRIGELIIEALQRVIKQRTVSSSLNHSVSVSYLTTVLTELLIFLF